MGKKRNVGIDLLRIVCMLMVVTQHVIGHGGATRAAVMFSARYEIAWLIEILCLCAVDCYAIITGYVMSESKVKAFNLVNLWLQVAFYSVVITVGMMIFVPGTVGRGTLFYSLFPVTFNSWWYFSAYFGMFLFLPFINRWLENISRRELKKFIVVDVVLIMVFPVVMQRDPFKFGYGYSMIWLLLMYILGAYLKKFVDLEKVSKMKCLVVYFACNVFLWGNKFVVDYSISKLVLGLGEHGSAFLTYNSIFVVMAAVSLFMFFAKLDIRSNKLKSIIAILSSVSFGVYLIHEHPLISSKFITDISVPFATSSTPVFTLKIIGTVLFIYIVCSFIDYLRLLLFKALKVKNLSIKIGNSIEGSIDRFIDDY